MYVANITESTSGRGGEEAYSYHGNRDYYEVVQLNFIIK